MFIMRFDSTGADIHHVFDFTDVFPFSIVAEYFQLSGRQRLDALNEIIKQISGELAVVGAQLLDFFDQLVDLRDIRAGDALQIIRLYGVNGRDDRAQVPLAYEN